MGRKGGKATGKCKVRGDHEYYVNLRLKGQRKKEKAPRNPGQSAPPHETGHGFSSGVETASTS